MNICVFSSSSDAINKVYVNEAIKLARMIGKKGMTLVNGGANVGLMEVMSKEAKKNGAGTIGIIPEKLKQNNLVTSHADEVLIAPDMMERKAKMREISDAFIALPGGFGTLEEILEVITLKQLSYHCKAIVFINTNGFYNDLFKQFERSYNEKFAKESYRKLFYVADNAELALDYIENYLPEEVDEKWFEVPKH